MCTTARIFYFVVKIKETMTLWFP